MLDMKTASVRDVQHHLSRVLAWVEQGEEVQITRRLGIDQSSFGHPRRAENKAKYL